MSGSSVRKQARRWLVKVQTSQDLESCWPDFEAWLRESPEHRRAYELEERKWVDCDFLRAWPSQDKAPTPESVLGVVAKARRHRQIFLAVRAAVTAATCLVPTTLLLIGLERGRVEAHTWVPYVAGADPAVPLSLDDGSVVQLNAHSRIRMRVTMMAREVALDTGEAYFDVSPRQAWPFSVEAGRVVVQAMGTEFSVRKEDNGQVETTVRKGKVEIGRGGEPRPQEVGAGELATIGPSGALTVGQVDSVKMAQRLGWANRVILLDGTLGEAVAQFNRYNARKLVIREVELAEIHVSGRYHVAEPDEFAESLKQLGIAHVVVGSESSAEHVILLSRKEP